MLDVQVITFGCRLNIFESEIIRQKATYAKLNNVIIINSCAVTKEAERQVKQKINKLLNTEQSKKIILVGCSAQNSWQEYKKDNRLFAVLGNREKLQQQYYDLLAIRSKEETPFIFVDNVLKKPPEIIEIKNNDNLFKFDKKTKAFVQIQQGCNYRCSFCVVPFIRGQNQSFSVTSIINQCRKFLAEGYKEIILTGVDIAAYGSDTKDLSLFYIIKKILDTFPELERLRLSSLDPARSYEQILGLMQQDKRLMPYLHLSIQSGDDNILKNMRRRHNSYGINILCKKIKKLSNNIAIGADIITGFPGETEDNFKNTYNLIKELNITHLHVFPYSQRTGTVASTMQEQIPIIIRKERAKKLRELGNKLKLQFIKKQKSKFLKVLVENNNQGYTENYIFVNIIGEKISNNSIVDVKIINILKDGTVFAKLV